MVSRLRRSAQKRKLYQISTTELSQVLDKLMAAEWVVYSKSCLNHTHTIVNYLARYTHRIAITNHRILSIDEERMQIRQILPRQRHQQNAKPKR